jgi:signal recognition particle receptor subunit beta
MAIIDKQNNLVSIRIVYDGRSGAGKTATIHNLRHALGIDKEVYSLDSGTTSYFDWLEYTGGQFDGMPINCQILTTPGAAEFKQRREYLLQQADILVFVVDSSNLAEITASFAELQAMEINCNILLQANKQDLSSPENNAEINKLFAPLVTKIIQTNALKNRGLREVFVTAVHLAIENLAQHETNSITIANPQQLLQLMQAPEMPANSEILGLDYIKVYPPLLGRNILQQLQEYNHSSIYANLQDEIWTVKLANDWCAWSKSNWLYSSETEAIKALREYISWQLICSSLLAEKRCLSIYKDGEQWRLWQITALMPNVATQLQQALQSDDVQHWATQLYIYSNAYLDGYHNLVRLGFELDLQPQNLAIDGTNILYLGAINAPATHPQDLATTHVLKQNILPLIHESLENSQHSLEDCILALENLQLDDSSHTAQALMDLLLELV